MIFEGCLRTNTTISDLLLVCLGLMLVLAAGCGTAHSVRPLGKGNTAVSLDLGGPPLGETKNAPLPMIDLGIQHGLDERSDVWAVLHILPMVLDRKPTIGMDFGLSRYVLDQRGGRPGIGLGVVASILANPGGAYAHIDIPVSFSWMTFGERWLHYIGFHGTVFLTGYRILDLPPLAWSPFIGTEVRVGKNRGFGIGGEITWYQPYVRNTDAVLDWRGIGGQGALSFQLRFRIYPAPKATEEVPP